MGAKRLRGRKWVYAAENLGWCTFRAHGGASPSKLLYYGEREAHLAADAADAAEGVDGVEDVAGWAVRLDTEKRKRGCGEKSNAAGEGGRSEKILRRLAASWQDMGHMRERQ